MPAKPMALFWRRFKKTRGCWVWEGCVGSNGYGYYANRLAHRVSYELHVGPIPHGMHIDHLCKNRRCVRPSHLEAVTQAENNRRSPKRPTLVCPQGHAKQPRSRCVTCSKESKRRWKANNRQQVNEAQRRRRRSARSR